MYLSFFDTPIWFSRTIINNCIFVASSTKVSLIFCVGRSIGKGISYEFAFVIDEFFKKPYLVLLLEIVSFSWTTEVYIDRWIANYVRPRLLRTAGVYLGYMIGLGYGQAESLTRPRMSSPSNIWKASFRQNFEKTQFRNGLSYALCTGRRPPISSIEWRGLLSQPAGQAQPRHRITTVW